MKAPTWINPSTAKLQLAFCFACALPAQLASAQTQSESAPFGDDIHTSTIQIHPFIQYSCPWISDGMNDFVAAHRDWHYEYAGQAASSFLETDLSVDAYMPWVVNEPTYTRTFIDSNGNPRTKTWGGGGPKEWGGALIALSYTPRIGSNDPTNIRWIQGVDSSYYGAPRNPHLDNPDDRTVPFYDFGDQDIAGKTYFADIPSTPENEYEGNPVAAVDFQAFIAQDMGAGGGFTHNVKIYGGVWWGYTYTAVETPEPVSVATLGIGIVAVLKRRRSRH